jgi:hypothetical protein
MHGTQVGTNVVRQFSDMRAASELPYADPQSSPARPFISAQLGAHKIHLRSTLSEIDFNLEAEHFLGALQARHEVPGRPSISS